MKIIGGNIGFVDISLLLLIIASNVYRSKYRNSLLLIIGEVFIILYLSYVEAIYIYLYPIVAYDFIQSGYFYISGLLIIPGVIMLEARYLTTYLLLMALCIYFSYMSNRTKDREMQYREAYDNERRLRYELERVKAELLHASKNIEHMAELRERNRIAREIHDNVGHLLSSSILQIGALLVTNKDENTKESLRMIKETLSKAMDSIRNSVHNLHDESIDLYTEIKTLINNFKFCPVEFDYDIEGNVEHKLKYCFIAVIRECLSNIARHSNATKANIVLREHPAIYQLIVQDNGTQINYEEGKGIGLKNISDRVASFSGNMNLSFDKGFKVFISIPKR